MGLGAVVVSKKASEGWPFVRPSYIRGWPFVRPTKTKLDVQRASPFSFTSENTNKPKGAGPLYVHF